MSNQILLLIQPFLDALKFEKRYSPHTIRAYHDDLTQFFTYIIKEYGGLGLSEISVPFVRSWLAHLKEEKRTAKSINRKLSSLKSFFKHQVRNGLLESTPMTNIIAPKTARRLPNYIDQKHIQLLLSNVVFPDNWEGKTHKLLINIFYNTGMRLNELVNLKESHIDDSNRTLKVLGKGNKERIIPVSAELIYQISSYRTVKSEAFEIVDKENLLVTKKGQKLYPRYVYRVVTDYLGKVTTLQKRSPHVLRHTFATHLTNNGADLNSIKELLGHSSLAATQIYTHNSIENLKHIHKKAHPKS